jgi:dinuclear metal center YbgI/SA1388 family protein
MKTKNENVISNRDQTSRFPYSSGRIQGVKPPTSITRHDLVAWLNDYLSIHKIADVSLNGLQLEGHEHVSRIAVAVDSTLATIEEAVASGSDFLIVHHGWFWKDIQPITGPLAKRVKAAIAGNLNLYAAHLPLDVHPEVGNNAVMAKALSLQNLEPFGVDRGIAIGVKGKLPVPQSLQDFADSIQKITGEVCLVHGGGTPMVSSVAILSGGGAGFVAQAAAAGADTFLTGEPEHAHFSDAFEYGVNTIFAGHYESETFGVRALAVKLEDTFGLPWQFLQLPTGL